MNMKTQNPDLGDIQVILDMLMESTEKAMVIRAARERAREDIHSGLVTGALDRNFLTQDPLWDPSNPSELEMIMLKRNQEWIP